MLRQALALRSTGGPPGLCFAYNCPRIEKQPRRVHRQVASQSPRQQPVSLATPTTPPVWEFTRAQDRVGWSGSPGMTHRNILRQWGSFSAPYGARDSRLKFAGSRPYGGHVRRPLRKGRKPLRGIKIGKCGSFRGTWPSMRFRGCWTYGWPTFERLGCTLGHIEGYKRRFWCTEWSARTR